MDTRGFELLQSILVPMLNAIPGFITAIVVLALGIQAAKAIAKIIQKVLAATPIDKFGEKLNDIELVQKANINVLPSNILSKFIYYILLLIVILVSTSILNMEPVSQLVRDIINYVPNLISALLVFVLGILLADSIKSATLTACKSLGMPSANGVANFVFYFIFLTTSVSALSQAKIDTDFIKSNLTVLLGGAAFAFALGYGWASKDMMSSFLASFYSKDKFELGDKITVEGVVGIIVELDNTSFTLETPTSHVVFPLSKLMTEKVEIHHEAPFELPTASTQLPKALEEGK
jgi:Conserved TM helix/Mechanosensitive ion channel